MPTTTEGSLTTEYIGPNSFLYAPTYRKNIYPNFREDTLINFLIHANRTRKVNNLVFSHAEDDWTFAAAEVESKTGTPGAGNNCTVVLKDANHQKAGTVSPFVPNETVVVHTATGDFHCLIHSKDKSTPNAHELVLHPLDSNDDIVTAIAADDLITIEASAWADGTFQPESQISEPLTFSNKVQNFKESFTSHGGEAANVHWFRYNGKKYYYVREVERTALRHYLKMQFQFIFGIHSDGAVDAEGRPVHTTRGLDQWQKAYGIDEPYSSSFQMEDLESIIKKLKNQRAGRDIIVLEGTDFCLQFDALVHDKIKTMGTDYTKMGVPGGNGSKRSVDFGFKEVTHGPFTFFRQSFDVFDYLPVTAYEGSTWSQTAFMMPYGYVRNRSNQPGDAKNIPTIGLCYRSSSKEYRFEKHWIRDYKITNKDEFEWNHHSECGLEVALADKIVKVYPS